MSNDLNNTVGAPGRAPKAKASNSTPVLAVVSFLAGLQCAMQFIAHNFEYQSALGAHLRHLSGPWSILHWASKWYGIYPDAFMRAGYIGLSVTALGLIALVIARMVLDRSVRRNPCQHGLARLANLKKIQLSGLLPRSRILWEVTTGKALTKAAHVYIGAWLDKRGTQYLRHNGSEHDLCYARTTSEMSRTGRKLIRRFGVGSGTQQNRRNNHALSVEEYLTITKVAARLKKKPKTTKHKMAAGMMEAGAN